MVWGSDSITQILVNRRLCFLIQRSNKFNPVTILFAKRQLYVSIRIINHRFKHKAQLLKGVLRPIYALDCISNMVNLHGLLLIPFNLQRLSLCRIYNSSSDNPSSYISCDHRHRKSSQIPVCRTNPLPEHFWRSA